MESCSKPLQTATKDQRLANKNEEQCLYFINFNHPRYRNEL